MNKFHSLEGISVAINLFCDLWWRSNHPTPCAKPDTSGDFVHPLSKSNGCYGTSKSRLWYEHVQIH